MVAMARPYRHPKTGIFWIRKVIPERLRPKFDGKREFKVTLRTRDPQEAKLLASTRLAEFERHLQEASGAPSIQHGKRYLPPPCPSFILIEERPQAPMGASPDIVEKTLLDIFVPWRRESEPKDKTADEYKKGIQEFHECVGVLAVQSIRAEHIRKYKDYLVSEKTLAAGSINKRLSVIKTLLNFAKMNGLIDSNAAQGFKVKRTKAVAQRHPFTNEEIKAIFSSPVFQFNHRPKAGAKEAAYWMPIIAYFTGARLEEIGQLSVEDIQEHEGCYFLEIMESTGELSKSVKTEAGKRIIPLHSNLLNLGFLDYVGKLKGKGRLFPALTPDRYGHLTQNWSKWWSRYVKTQVGIQESGKTFHAFRHTFAQLWKECGADHALKDAVMGHSSNNVQDRYGGWRNPKNGRVYLASPQQLMQEISKLSFGVFG